MKASSAVRRAWILADVRGDVPGGMRRHMELHAKGLRALGVEARTLYSDSGAHLPRLLDSRAPGARLLLGLWKEVRQERPDYINVHTLAAPAWIVARATGFLHARVVVMSYASDERALAVSPREVRGVGASLRWARVALPARATFPSASGIWCVNQEDARFYTSTYGIDPSRVLLCPHAIEEAFFVPASTRRRPLQLLFVGTWIWRKGTDILAGAVSRALREMPDATFVAAGTLGSADEVHRAFAEDVRSRIRVQPHVDDEELRQLYGESALLLVPSRLEGLPFSLLEAMAQGCPALAASNSGMADVITPDRNGWLLGEFDPWAWAERIVSILRSPESLACASRGAREAAERFRVVPVTRRALDWIESLH